MVPQSVDAKSDGMMPTFAQDRSGGSQRKRRELAKLWVCLLLAVAPFVLMFALWRFGFR